MWPWTGSPAGSRSGSERRARPGAAGFTLFEVLIAFVILALALAALLPGFSGGARSLDVADRYTTAALLAESRLEAVGRAEALREGVTSGTFDNGFRWQLEVARVDRLDPEGNLPAAAYHLTLRVLWQAGDDEREIVLETLRLGPRQERRR